MKVETLFLDQRLNEELKYATPGAAAVDLRACGFEVKSGRRFILEMPTVVPPGGKMKIATGIAMHLGGAYTVEPDGTIAYMLLTAPDEPEISVAALLLPRSGLGTNFRVRLANTVGLLDSDYQGEIMLTVENAGSESFTIEPLMRLAQMMVIPVIKPEYVSVAKFRETTKRGTGGHGSTGA